MKIIKTGTLIILLIFLSTQVSKAQIGIGTNTPSSSSALDISSNSKGLLLPRMSTDERNSIVNPANGLIIYNTTIGCLQVNQGNASNPEWVCFSNPSISPTSNGTAIVSSYTSNTDSAGSIIAGVAVSAVSQTITANVSSVGTYQITASKNGVVFKASGTFTSTGPQTIVLTASGTSTQLGNNSYNLDISPASTFARTTLSSSSNGTAIVSSYSCNTMSNGNMIKNTAIGSGVTQTITANVTTKGTYNISTTVNGVTFSGQGTFTNTGSRDIVLVASGTPNTSGIIDFTLNTLPNCSFSRAIFDNSSNSLSVISAFTVSSTRSGTLYVSNTPSGVSQTITANVTTIGPYSISATQNGVTFSASGNFTSIGSQNIVLTATGAPTSVGNFTFTLNTTPNCSFEWTVLNISSGGSASISSVTCNTASSGNLTQGVSSTGITQSITANVASTGTYSISTNTVNGITFSGSGTLSTTGNQTIILNASGIPTNIGSYSYTINSTPSCSFDRTAGGGAQLGSTFTSFSNGSQNFSSNTDCAAKLISAGHTLSTCSGTVTTPNATYTEVFINGQCWMKENLNEPPTAPCAAPVNTSCNVWNNNLVSATGLWGYYNTSVVSGASGWGTSQPAAGEGILYQWNAAMNNTTSERSKGACPTGWHIPSDCEWMYLEHGLGMSITDQTSSGSSFRTSGAVATKMSSVIPSGTNSSGFTGLLSGMRNNNGNFLFRSNYALWWTSTSTSSTFSYRRYMSNVSNGLIRSSNDNALAFSVRCIKD